MPTSSTGRAGAWVICTVGELLRHRGAGRQREQQRRSTGATRRAAHVGLPDRRMTAGRSGSGELVRSAAGGQGQGQPELCTGAGLTPDLQPAPVQPRVLEADRQAEPAAADGPDPRRIGPPEPVEDVLRLGRGQARRRGRAPSRRPRSGWPRA